MTASVAAEARRPSAVRVWRWESGFPGFLPVCSFDSWCTLARVGQVRE